MAMHRWRGYDHRELFDMINGGPGPAASTPQTEYWDALYRELAEIDSDLNAKLTTLQAGWTGTAGEQAQTGLTPLQAWASDAQTGASGMRASTEYQADIVSRARASMPEPVEVTTPAPSGWDKLAAGAALLTGNAGPAAAVAGQAQDHEAQEAAQDAASQKAVDAMDNYQSSSNFNTSTLGEFVPPPDVVVSTPDPSGGTGYSAASYSAGFGGTGHNASYSQTSHTTHQVNVGGGNGYVVPAGDPNSVHHTGYTDTTGQTKPSTFTPIQTQTTTPSHYTPTLGDPRANLHYDPNYSNFNGSSPYRGPDFATTGGGNFRGDLGPNVNGVNGINGADSGKGPLGKGGLGSGAGNASLPNDAARQGGQLGRGGMSGNGAFGGPGENIMGTRGGAAGGARGGLGGGGMGGNNGGQDEESDERYESATYLVETDDVFGDERAVAQPVLGIDQ